MSISVHSIAGSHPGPAESGESGSAPLLSVVSGPATLGAAFDRLTSTVAVITVMDGDRPTGLALQSLAVLSHQPPLISFAVPVISSRWPALVHADHIGVHLLSAAQAALAERFAPRRTDGFAAAIGPDSGPRNSSGLGWCPGSHGVPVLSGCATSAVALIEQRVHSGDGALIVARLLEATTQPGTPLLLRRQG